MAPSEKTEFSRKKYLPQIWFRNLRVTILGLKIKNLKEHDFV